MKDFAKAFTDVEGQATREAVDKGNAVLPIEGPTAKQRCGIEAWAMLKASRFVTLCMEMDLRHLAEDDSRNWSTDHLWDGDDGHVNTIEMPARMKIDASSFANFEKRAKIAWNEPVWRDILNTAAVRAYVRAVAEARNIDVPVSGTSHFCGIDLFPTVTVNPHPCWDQVEHQGKGRGKGASFVTQHEEKEKEKEKAGEGDSGSGESGSESSGSESSGDEDENAGKSKRASLSDNEDEDMDLTDLLDVALARGARRLAKRARVSE